MKFKKIVSILLTGVMAMSLIACSSGNKSTITQNSSVKSESKSQFDTIVIALSEVNGIFSPIFSTTHYDQFVSYPVFSLVSQLSDDNVLIDDAGNISYKEIKDDTNNISQVEYTVKLKEGITFSDGKPLTIDDYIFTLYLLLDPAYDGTNTLSSLNIQGLKEYREGGEAVTEISGIKKVDDLTATILTNGVNISGDRLLANIAILPKHYYGVGNDGTEFKKGDMTVPKSRNEAPMGSGPYIFKSFDKNLVTFEANPNYFKGAPKTPNLKMQVVEANNKVDTIINGDIDIADPPADKETMARLNAEGLEYNLVDNNGYGFVGMNADRIKDKNVRKGLMHLMNREPSVKSYYGDTAEVIERPLTTVLAEYPQNAEAYYPYDKAKALEYFTSAGYKKDATGKLVDANGNQLKVEVGVPDLKNSPTAGIFSQMKIDMEEIGAELLVSDLAFNVLVDRINTGDIDMFALSWTGMNNPDLTQLYHSSLAGVAGANIYNLRDPEVDKLLEEVATTLDLEKRKELVAKELDLIMENAIVMPIFQRKNLNIFSKNLKIDTVYKSSSPFYTYKDEIHLIEMN